MSFFSKAAHSIGRMIQALLGNSPGGSASQEATSELGDAIDRLLASLGEKKENAGDENFMENFFIDNQIIMLEEVRDALSDPNNSDLSSGEIAQKASDRMKDRMDAYMKSDSVQDSKQDYHNSDPLVISLVSDKLFQGVVIDTNSSDRRVIEAEQCLNGLLREQSNHAASCLGAPPDSPAVKKGLIDPEQKISNDMEKSPGSDMSNKVQPDHRDDGPAMRGG